MFGRLPAYALYVRHADNLRLSGVEFEVESADRRPALILEDVSRVRIEGFEAQSGDSAVSLVKLRSSGKALFLGCRALPGTGTFLRLEAGTVDCSVFGSDLSQAAKAFEFAPSVPENALFENSNRLP